jgi:hypothetical protein
MRKLLLASAAVLGGTLTMASVANAQGQLMTQYPYTPPTGSAAPLSAPSFGTSIQTWTGNPPVSPGTMTVRLGGRLTAYVAAGTDSARSGGAVTNIVGGVPTVGALNTKQAPYTVFEYARLYPSFDAQAANGLKYGAFLEIRQDNGQAPGGGVNGSISGSNRTRGELYFRREGAYLGTDQLGFLQYGATDGPSSLFITGTMENFDDGGWNGDPNMFSANTTPTWPFADVGNMYTTSKLVYLSPKFFNLLDFGVSFEPNTGTVGYAQCNGTTAAPSAANNFVGTGCDAASSTSVLGETARRTNTIDVAARVRTAVGPVGLAGTVGYIGSSHVSYNGAPTAGTQFQGLSVLDVGAQVTFGGLAVGGHFTGGKVNGQWALSPQGADNSIAWLGGASYAIGPVIFGASYFNYQSPGSKTAFTPAVVGNRTEYGIAAGGTLTLAPGAYVFLSYVYGSRRQSGVDLISGAVSNAAGVVTTNNKVTSQGIELGTQFRW